jgi:hypothetical protein
VSLRFMDGFDHYATADISLKWTSSSSYGIAATGGRFGAGKGFTSFGSAGYVYKTLDNQATWIVGCAYNGPAATSQVIVALLDAGSAQIELRLDASNHVVVTRNGTVLGTSVATFNPTIYHYYELKATIHPSTGSYEVQVDGLSVLSGSGANTRNTANSYANQVSFLGSPASGGTNLGTNLDDIYICDGTGAANNNFLGDTRIYSLYPASAGNSTQWTPSAGANYAAVDEAAQNGDTDYVADSTVGHTDTYTMQDMPAGAVVKAVQTNLVVRKDDAGLRQVAPVLRPVATDRVGTTVTLATSYVIATQQYDTNPETSAAWTAAEVNATEFGVTVIA